MGLSRRQFIIDAALASAAWPLVLDAQDARDPASTVFREGVASGDPLTDRVVLWTRVTLPARPKPVDVRWTVADDERLTRIVAAGEARTAAERDFTVKVDVGSLQPGRTYYYAFSVAGQQSSVGRTRTLPAPGVARLTLAVVSCSNYPVGYFNAYRCIANRPDVDAVVHLGDYIYESYPRAYSDGSGSGSGRRPLPAGEATTLADYRLRYAVYRSDVDLQAVHAQHPFIAVWDDHELANDSWSGGIGQRVTRGWASRRAAAYRAYLEWMPVREPVRSGIRLYRGFRFGDLVDLLMLDTRGLRDRLVAATNQAALNDPKRSLLGATQEAWLAERLRASQRDGAGWRLLGQQVVFSPIARPGVPRDHVDAWDGYPQARRRVLDVLEKDRIADVAILTGDFHSSWAFDVPRDPWSAPGSPASRSLATELVTPAISSAPFFTDPGAREETAVLRQTARHLKFVEGESRGYILLDVTRERMLADWYFVRGVTERSPQESKAASFVSERGSSRLVAA